MTDIEPPHPIGEHFVILPGSKTACRMLAAVLVAAAIPATAAATTAPKVTDTTAPLPPPGIAPYVPPATQSAVAPPSQINRAAKAVPQTKTATEVGVTAPGTIGPVSPVTPAGPGHMAPQSLLRKTISAGAAGWLLARGEPGRFMVAAGQNGWGFDVVTQRDYQGSRFGWLSGGTYADGNPRVAGCLWMQSDYLAGANTPATADCSPYGSVGVASYMAIWNGNRRGVNCNPGWQCDGSLTYLDNAALCSNGTWLYQNVRPWVPNAPYPIEAYQWVPYGTPLLWRYVTRDNRFVSVRMPSRGAQGVQDWGFMTGACFTNLGYAESYTTAQ